MNPFEESVHHYSHLNNYCTLMLSKTWGFLPTNTLPLDVVRRHLQSSLCANLVWPCVPTRWTSTTGEEACWVTGSNIGSTSLDAQRWQSDNQFAPLCPRGPAIQNHTKVNGSERKARRQIPSGCLPRQQNRRNSHSGELWTMGMCHNVLLEDAVRRQHPPTA